MQAPKGWPVPNNEPLRLPPRPGIKTPAFYTTDCPVCHQPHKTQSDYVDCRIGNQKY